MIRQRVATPGSSSASSSILSGSDFPATRLAGGGLQTRDETLSEIRHSLSLLQNSVADIRSTVVDIGRFLNTKDRSDSSLSGLARSAASIAAYVRGVGSGSRGGQDVFAPLVMREASASAGPSDGVANGVSSASVAQ